MILGILILFFYTAGLLYRFGAVALAALSLIALLVPSGRDLFRGLLSSVVWVFLAGASVMVLGCLWSLFDFISSNPSERIASLHAYSSDHYGLLTDVFSAVSQLLWFERFRQRPLSVLVIAAASLLPWATEKVL